MNVITVRNDVVLFMMGDVMRVRSFDETNKKKMNIQKIQDFYNSEEYVKKLRTRVENVKALSVDPISRMQLMTDVYQYDFERFCEDILFLMLPEFGDAIKPFFLFDYQRKIIDKLEWAEMDGGDQEILIDKPRGMGITWLVVSYFYWKWLFKPNWTAFILSRTETEVDDGTASPGNSIFSKLRWTIAHTPKWMLPDGFKPKGEKGTATDSTLKLINPMNGAGIFGSSTNSSAGRSRRYSVVFMDECFAIEHFTETVRSLTSVARIQIFVSTTKASREAKNFKDRVEKAGNYISLDWRDHPWKDQEWYESMLAKAEFDPEVMKEVDKGYAVSEKMQYYPDIKLARTVGIQYNPNLPLFCGLDFGKKDYTVIIWAQFDGNQINILECYGNNNKGKVTWYAPFLNRDSPIETDEHFVYTPKALDLMKKVRSWEKPTGYFGELAHSIKSMADNTSIATTLAKCGIRIMYNQFAVEHSPRRQATSLLLPKMVFNESSTGVMKLYDCITNSRWKKGSTDQPEHDDEIADYRAALENLCVNVGRIFKHQRKESSAGSMNSSGFIGKLIQSLKV